MGRLSELHDRIASVESIVGAAERLEGSFETRKKDRESGMDAFYSKGRDKYYKKTYTLIVFCAIVWLFFIIATVILCIRGNDIVLRWLSL